MRLFPLQLAQGSGALNEMVALSETCMADYYEDGWKAADYQDGSDISLVR